MAPPKLNFIISKCCQNLLTPSPKLPLKYSETPCTVQNSINTFKTLKNLLILSKISKILRNHWYPKQFSNFYDFEVSRGKIWIYIYILRLFINSSSESVNKKFHIISTNIVAFFKFFFFGFQYFFYTTGYQTKYTNQKINHRRITVL